MLFLGVMAPSGGFLPSARVPSSTRLGDGVGPAALRYSGAPADVFLCFGSELWPPDRVLGGFLPGDGSEV
jgi:hypothetical protein